MRGTRCNQEQALPRYRARAKRPNNCWVEVAGSDAFAICNPCVPFLYVYVCTRLLRATADSAWLSKQLKNGSSWPRTSEAADRGKHAYPESGLQIAENRLGEELHGDQ